MKSIIASVCSLLLYSYSIAQKDTVKVNTTLTNATVYFGYGAELTHKSKVIVNKNTRYIVLDKLSTQLDLNSVQISCPETVSLLSHQFTTYTPPTKVVPKSALVQRYNDTIKTISKAIGLLQSKVAIEELTLQKTEKMIEATIATSSNKTALTAEVLKLIDYYNAKVEKNKTAIFNYSSEIGNLNERLQILHSKIEEAEPTNQQSDDEDLAKETYGRMIIQVVSRVDLEVPIALSYFTNNAGWQPIYDIRVNSSTNQIKLVYKASVVQNTGINWKQTKLTLSTGTPSFTTTAPVFNAWYLQYYVPELYRSMDVKTTALGNTNFNYDNNLKRNQIQNVGGEYKMDDEKSIEPSTLQKYTELSQGLLNTNFEIDLPYDIESNGMAHSINIKEETLKSNLKNYAIPKLDKEAYLLAELTDWQNLDLIPGNANIIMDDTYIGKSFIDPNTTADTLNLSLGKDKRVAVKRVLVKDASTTKTKDNFTKQTFTYELTVKNNKQKELNMLLKDQYPLSNVKEIEVVLDNDGDAINNQELGVLTWKLNLKPGEVKKFRFSYTIKYPKDKKIANLK